MTKNKNGKQLMPFMDLFAPTENEVSEYVVSLSLEELLTFKNHPFQVEKDEAMDELVDSIQENGVLVPIIVRPVDDGKYEIISGHRRCMASRILKKDTIPAVIREISDDEAIVTMVDANIQREYVKDSEKAKAYGMKYHAMKRQGAKDGQFTLGEMGNLTGESPSTVQRYVWLSRLIDPLLELVDTKKMGKMQAVDISYLNKDEQMLLYTTLMQDNKKLTTRQSEQIKKASQEQMLNESLLKIILLGNDGPKESMKRVLSIQENHLRKYFAPDYSIKDMQDIIFSLLDKWLQEKEDS